LPQFNPPATFLPQHRQSPDRRTAKSRVTSPNGSPDVTRIRGQEAGRLRQKSPYEVFLTTRRIRKSELYCCMLKDMRVEDLTIDELKVLIDYTVEQKLEELLGDPDSNLHLREDVKERFDVPLNSRKVRQGCRLKTLLRKPHCGGNALSSRTQTGSA